jgi:S1-C subfamily serine protease
MTLRSLNEDIARLAEKASESVVEVRARRGTPSSGVAFSEDGLVATAEHTLEIEEGIEIANRNGEVFPAELLGRDPSTGVALLRATKARLVPPSWRDSFELGAFELALVVASSRTRANRSTGTSRSTPARSRVSREASCSTREDRVSV